MVYRWKDAKEALGESAPACTVLISPKEPFAVLDCEPSFVRLISAASRDQLIGESFSAVVGCTPTSSTNTLITLLSEVASAADDDDDDATMDLGIVQCFALDGAAPVAHSLRVRPMRIVLTRELVALACTLRRVPSNEVRSDSTIDRMRALALRELEGREQQAPRVPTGARLRSRSSSLSSMNSRRSSTASNSHCADGAPISDLLMAAVPKPSAEGPSSSALEGGALRRRSAPSAEDGTQNTPSDSPHAGARHGTPQQAPLRRRFYSSAEAVEQLFARRALFVAESP